MSTDPSCLKAVKMAHNENVQALRAITETLLTVCEKAGIEPTFDWLQTTEFTAGASRGSHDPPS